VNALDVLLLLMLLYWWST